LGHLSWARKKGDEEKNIKEIKYAHRPFNNPQRSKKIRII